jgi:integrase
LYRYGPNGTIYLCRKTGGKNVWKSLQTTDRKRAMAISTLLSCSAAQNGNHDVTVLLDAVSSALPTTPPEWMVREPVIRPSEPSKAAPPGPIPMHHAARKGTTVTDLVARFKAQWGHLAPATCEKLDFHFKVAARHFDFERDITCIRLAEMRVLKSKLSEGRKPSTVNDILFKALGGLFKLAVEDGLIERSPLEGLKRARRRETERQQPSWEQAQVIVEEVARLAPESGLMAAMMRNFGVGQAEIRQLRGEHIDPGAGVIHFRRKKTGKSFDVPIFPYAQPFIESLLAEGRLKVGRAVVEWRNPRKALASACERLGLPVYEPRSLRRCYIVHCLELGVDPRLVARWQGHRDAALIFKVYGNHIDAKYERREADKLIRQ